MISLTIIIALLAMAIVFFKFGVDEGFQKGRESAFKEIDEKYFRVCTKESEGEE